MKHLKGLLRERFGTKDESKSALLIYTLRGRSLLPQGSNWSSFTNELLVFTTMQLDVFSFFISLYGAHDRTPDMACSTDNPLLCLVY